MPAWLEELLHIVTGRRSTHGSIPDLRHLPSTRVQVERTHFLVDDRERRSQEDRLYVLRRQRSSHPGRANVAVFSNGRGVGYLPDAAAREMGPLLDRMGGAALVNGVGAATGSLRLRVDLPTRDAMTDLASQPAC